MKKKEKQLLSWILVIAILIVMCANTQETKAGIDTGVNGGDKLKLKKLNITLASSFTDEYKTDFSNSSGANIPIPSAVSFDEAISGGAISDGGIDANQINCIDMKLEITGTQKCVTISSIEDKDEVMTDGQYENGILIYYAELDDDGNITTTSGLNDNFDKNKTNYYRVIQMRVADGIVYEGDKLVTLNQSELGTEKDGANYYIVGNERCILYILSKVTLPTVQPTPTPSEPTPTPSEPTPTPSEPTPTPSEPTPTPSVPTPTPSVPTPTPSVPTPTPSVPTPTPSIPTPTPSIPTSTPVVTPTTTVSPTPAVTSDKGQEIPTTIELVLGKKLECEWLKECSNVKTTNKKICKVRPNKGVLEGLKVGKAKLTFTYEGEKKNVSVKVVSKKLKIKVNLNKTKLAGYNKGRLVYFIVRGIKGTSILRINYRIGKAGKFKSYKVYKKKKSNSKYKTLWIPLLARKKYRFQIQAGIGKNNMFQGDITFTSGK